MDKVNRTRNYKCTYEGFIVEIQGYCLHFRGLEKSVQRDYNYGNRLYTHFPAPLVLSIRGLTWETHCGRTTKK
jgi:hypothetical protein